MRLENFDVPIILFYSFVMVVLSSSFYSVQALPLLILMCGMGFFFFRSMFVAEHSGWKPLMNKKYVWQQWKSDD